VKGPVNNQPLAPVIISEVTPTSHNRDLEKCLLSEEWNPVSKNWQQILVFYIILLYMVRGVNNFDFRFFIN
jgi:hypothetical protein